MKIGDEIVDMEVKSRRPDLFSYLYAFYNTKLEAFENVLYPSRQSVIESQIEYWTCLLKQEISTCSDDGSMECEHDEYTAVSGNAMCRKCGKEWECDHESDGKHIGLNEFGTPCECNCNKCGHESDGVRYRDPEAMPGQSRLKCKKCGEFYR